MQGEISELNKTHGTYRPNPPCGRDNQLSSLRPILKKVFSVSTTSAPVGLDEYSATAVSIIMRPYVARMSEKTLTVCYSAKPNTYSRRDSTVELSRVGLARCVSNSQLARDDCRRIW